MLWLKQNLPWGQLHQDDLRTRTPVLQHYHGTRSQEVLVADLTFEILIIQHGIGQRKSIQDDKSSVGIEFGGKVHSKVFLTLVCWTHRDSIYPLEELIILITVFPLYNVIDSCEMTADRVCKVNINHFWVTVLEFPSLGHVDFTFICLNSNFILESNFIVKRIWKKSPLRTSMMNAH